MDAQQDRPLKIAMFGCIPLQGWVPSEYVWPIFRDKPEHPAPWIRMLCSTLPAHGNVHIEVITESRRLRRDYSGTYEGVKAIALRKIEPGKTDPWHLFVPTVFRLRRVLRAIRPDLLHGFGTELPFGLAAVRAFAPTVVMVQGTIEHYHPYLGWSPLKVALWKMLERRALRKAAGVTANTAFSAKWAEQINPAARVVVMPNICQPEYFSCRPTFDWKLILCIGELCRRKGTDTVLRAFAVLNDPEARMVLCGWSSDKKRYVDLARALGVIERVEFAGKESALQLVQRMAHARMVVIAARMDISPNVIIEAHAAGLPVVGTRAGGIPDMIEDGRDGYLVEPENPEALASAMRYLLDHPEVGQRMGAAGREKVARINSPEAVARAHLELYRAVLADFAARKSR